MRVILCLTLLAMLPAYAGGGDDTTATATSDIHSDVSTAVHDSSRAVGLGLGDVDINECYRSYQLVVFWQGTQVNPICLADTLDQRGLYAVAAKVRCDIKAIRKHFASEAECIAANTVKVSVPEPVVVPVDDEDYHRELEQELAMLRADFEAKVANMQRPRVQREVVQRGLTDEQKTALREVVK